MRGPRAWLSLMGWLFLSCATACLASGSAFAASSLVVSSYININPIVVCSATGTACAPVNNIGQTGANAQIGFFDTVANQNATDEILSKELGVRVVFGPLQQFNSPNSSYGTTYGTLHFTSSTGDCNNLSSDDFNTLVQTFNLVAGSSPPAYTVPNPTTPPGGKKACTVTNGILQPSCVPISQYATTSNMFFISNMVFNQPNSCTGVLTGFGKIGGNGIAINGPHVFSLPYCIDCGAHELSHDLGLSHNTTSNSDLMAPGGSRTEPTAADLAAGLGNTGLGTSFDALNSTEKATVLDPSGFLNQILEVTTTIMGPTTPNSNTFLVTVQIPKTTNPLSVISMFWEVLPPLGFQPNTFKVTSNPDFLNVTARNFQGNLGQDIFCGPGSFKCLEIDINSPSVFQQPDTFTFSIQMSNSNKNTQLCDLAGSDFTYLTDDQFVTTSGFASSPPCPTTPAPSNLTADSTIPNTTVRAFVSNAGLFTPATNTTCTSIEYSDPANGGACPNTSISDF